MSNKWKLTIGSSKGGKFVNLYLDGKRYRYWNGKTIGVNIRSSKDPDLLKSAFELKLIEGWRPSIKPIKRNSISAVSLIDEVEYNLHQVTSANYSYHHKRDCRWVFNEFNRFLIDRNLIGISSADISLRLLTEFINQPKWSNRTQRNVLTTLKCLSHKAFRERLKEVIVGRAHATLHKPIRDVQGLLNDIRSYNENLYLTCLLTYCCLLRPHQEIRLLKWNEINLNKGIISLSGNRNKSKRNRIVPMPKVVRNELSKIENHGSKFLLSNNEKHYSKDYLSVLWRRYKSQSSLPLEGVTLYSFRHSGAIHVFEKTGSLLKLQQVMGHSDMQVSLTYLRGLEVNQLNVDDLPEI